MNDIELIDLAFKLEAAAESYYKRYEEVMPNARNEVVWLKNELTGFGVAITLKEYRADELIKFINELI